MPPALLVAFGTGALVAVMYLAVLIGSTGGMILVYLAPLPLFLTGLALGTNAVLVAVGVAVVAIAGVVGNLVLPAVFLVFSGVPVALAVRQALLARRLEDGTVQWYPPGLLMVTLTALGAVGILAASLAAAMFGDADGLKSLIRSMLVSSLVEVFQGSGLPDAATAGNAAADIITAVLPGVVAVSWLMMVIVNGLLAQSLLARFNRLVRPPLCMSAFELPGWTPLVFALTLVGAMMFDGELGFIAVNLAVIQALPFLFAGLAVVHAFAASRPSKMAILVAFYLLVSLLAWPVLAVIGLGIIEQWAGLGRRFAAGGPDRGET